MTNFDKILAAAKAKKGQENLPKVETAAIVIETIKDRVDGDTRPLNQDHVIELAESITALGLIHPLVIDNQNRLLAGGHRRAALKLLKETQPQEYQRLFPSDAVPVHVMPFDSSIYTDLALAIEAAENEKRRDYTPAEVRAIADRLKAAGYVDIKGRPRKGQKPLMQGLSVVVGKNIRTVQRYLEGDVPEKNPKSTTHVVLLNQALSKLKKWQQDKPKTPGEKTLAEEMPRIISLIEDALDSAD